MAIRQCQCIFKWVKRSVGRSQWPRPLRRGSAAASPLRLWIRIPPRARMSICCLCCVLSGRVFCDELITPPEESYRLWYVVVCDLATSLMRRPCPAGGRIANKKKRSVSFLVSQKGEWGVRQKRNYVVPPPPPFFDHIVVFLTNSPPLLDYNTQRGWRIWRFLVPRLENPVLHMHIVTWKESVLLIALKWSLKNVIKDSK